MASRVAALILLGVICLGLVTAQVPVDCCLTVSGKRMRANNLVAYAIQEAGKGCDIDATIFFTKTGRALCVVPAKKLPWVPQIIAMLDNKKRSP